jgi:hypothetical protein
MIRETKIYKINKFEKHYSSFSFAEEALCLYTKQLCQALKFQFTSGKEQVSFYQEKIINYLGNQCFSSFEDCKSFVSSKDSIYIIERFVTKTRPAMLKAIEDINGNKFDLHLFWKLSPIKGDSRYDDWYWFVEPGFKTEINEYTLDEMILETKNGNSI